MLFVSEVRLDRKLGAGRALIDTIEELRRRGVHVETYDAHDAFGSEPRPRSDRLRPLLFARRARDFVRENASRFDVVESIHGSFPYRKREIGFDGLLVARSTGLVPFYLEYTRYEQWRWPELVPGTRVGRSVNRVADRLRLQAWKRSLETSDVVRVLNGDESSYVRHVMGMGSKVLELGEGLPSAYARSLAAAASDSRRRIDQLEVCCIGSWCLRKGAADWGQIIRTVTAAIPAVRFSFLGTGVPRARVQADMGLDSSVSVEVVPVFEPEHLPDLLKDAAVGALPSYIEGCPLGVLEQLSAGIPTVAYDVPGPRSMLCNLSLLVERGDARGIGERLIEILRLDPVSHSALSDACVRQGSGWALESTTETLLRRYTSELARGGRHGMEARLVSPAGR